MDVEFGGLHRRLNRTYNRVRAPQPELPPYRLVTLEVRVSNNQGGRGRSPDLLEDLELVDVLPLLVAEIFPAVFFYAIG
jgi:hypothetical protein